VLGLGNFLATSIPFLRFSNSPEQDLLGVPRFAVRTMPAADRDEEAKRFQRAGPAFANQVLKINWRRGRDSNPR
jgi:hypothetical protein